MYVGSNYPVSGNSFHHHQSVELPSVASASTISLEELNCYDIKDLITWVKSTDERGKTPLAHAVEGYTGHDVAKKEVIEFLLESCEADPNQGDNGNWTPLYRACTKSREDIIPLLLDYSADPNIRNSDGSTPLHRLVDQGAHDGIQALLSKSKTGRIDLNVINSFGTPLAYAAKNGNVQIAEALLNVNPQAVLSPVDVNLVSDPLASTPLEIAKVRGQTEMEKLLIAHGGMEILPIDSDRHTALSRLVFTGTDKQAILESQAKRETDEYGRTAAHYCAALGKKELLQGMEGIDLADNQGRTPLHYAIMKGKTTTVNYLIHDGECALDHRDKQGYGPLMWACQFGRLEISKDLLAKAEKDGVVEKILNLQDSYGWKCSHKAAETNSVAIFKLFVETYHMDFMEKNSAGNSPKDLAQRTQANEVLAYIETLTTPLPEDAAKV